MSLPAYSQDWPRRWADELAERAAIMTAEGVLDADAKAEACVRRQAEAESGECRDLFGNPMHARTSEKEA